MEMEKALLTRRHYLMLPISFIHIMFNYNLKIIKYNCEKKQNKEKIEATTCKVVFI